VPPPRYEEPEPAEYAPLGRRGAAEQPVAALGRPVDGHVHLLQPALQRDLEAHLGLPVDHREEEASVGATRLEP